MADHSFLKQPDIPVPMHVFRGGGMGDALEGGAIAPSLLAQPATPVEMHVYKGGGPGSSDPSDPSATEIQSFRGIQELKEIPKDMIQNAVLLHFISEPSSADFKVGQTSNMIPILPVVRIEDGSLLYLAGNQIETQDVESLFFILESGKPITKNTVNTLGSKPYALVFFLPELLSHPLTPFTPTSLEDLQKAESASTVSVKNIVPSESKESSPMITLSNGLLVRLVTDEIKPDILALKFTADEKYIFQNILGLSYGFVIEWLKKSENQEKFFSFWKNYILYNGVDTMTFTSKRKGRELQGFLRNLLEEYRRELVDEALGYIYKKEKGVEDLGKYLSEGTYYGPFYVRSGESKTELVPGPTEAKTATGETGPTEETEEEEESVVEEEDDESVMEEDEEEENENAASVEEVNNTKEEEEAAKEEMPKEEEAKEEEQPLTARGLPKRRAAIQAEKKIKGQEGGRKTRTRRTKQKSTSRTSSKHRFRTSRKARSKQT